jgi:hypothetical protein
MEPRHPSKGRSSLDFHAVASRNAFTGLRRTKGTTMHEAAQVSECCASKKGPSRLQLGYSPSRRLGKG